MSDFLKKYDLDKLILISLLFISFSLPILMDVSAIYYDKNIFLTLSLFAALTVYTAPKLLGVAFLIVGFGFSFINASNILTMGLPFYPDQFAAFVTAPAVAMEMAQGRTELSSILLGLLWTLPLLLMVPVVWRARARSKWTVSVVFLLVSGILFQASTASFELYRHANGLSKGAASIYGAFFQQTVVREEARTPDFERKADRILFVIGESESSDAMELHGAVEKTNPLLTKRDDIIVFNNMVATGSYTKSAIDKMMFYESGPEILASRGKPSLWQYADKAGLDVSRITSHSLAWGAFYKDNHSSMDYIWDSRMENEDSPVFYLLDDMKVLNEIVTPYLAEKEAFYSTFRISGSHVPFKDRYPEEFEKFEAPYFNTLLYTDYVLNEVLDQVPAEWVFWVSDHGVSYEPNERISSFIKPPTDAPKEWLQMLIKNKDRPLSQYDLTKTQAWLMGYDLEEIPGISTYNLLLEEVPEYRMRYSADMPYGKFNLEVPIDGGDGDRKVFYGQTKVMTPTMLH